MSLIYGLDYKYVETAFKCDNCARTAILVFDFRAYTISPKGVYFRCAWCLPSNYVINARSLNRVRTNMSAILDAETP